MVRYPTPMSAFQIVSPDRLPATLFARRKHWAGRLGVAPVLPTSRAEMDALGWDSCDVVLVTGDAYVDHPSFGMALVGRLLEAQGFRVGMLDQPNHHAADAFSALGAPALFFGVTAGNMDSLVNHYTSDKKPFEGIGLAPDIAVKSNAVLMRAGSDPVLERAQSAALSSPGR